jgi:hypothetical protein
MQLMNCLPSPFKINGIQNASSHPSEGARHGLCLRAAPEDTINLLPFGRFSQHSAHTLLTAIFPRQCRLRHISDGSVRQVNAQN